MVEMELVDDDFEIGKVKRREGECEYMVFDDEIVKTNTMCMDVESSTLIHGISIRETIMCNGNRMILGRISYEHLIYSMEKLGYGLGNFAMYEDFKKKVELLCYRNKYPAYSKLDVRCWYDTSMVVKKVHFIIKQECLSDFPYNKVGEKTLLKTFDGCCMPYSEWISLKMSTYIESIAHEKMRAEGYWGACIRNMQNEIIRTTRGNLFLIIQEKNDVMVYGVDKKRGAYNEVLTDVFETALFKAKYDINYVSGFTPQMVEKSMEAFILDSRYGVQFVLGIDNKRYLDNGLTKQIIDAFRIQMKQD